MHRFSVFRTVIVLAAVLAVLAGSPAVSARQDTPESDDLAIVGAWVTTVAVDGAPQPFTVLQTYEPGGTVTSENLPATVADPAAPVDTLYIGSGVGAWEQTDSGTYAATIAVMYGDLDGNLIAIETVSWEVDVDATGAAFTGPATFIGTDPAGNPLYSGTATLTGARITVQEPGTPVALPSSATPAA
jgi:hypothetical protein